MINSVCMACKVGVFMDKTFFYPSHCFTMKLFIVVEVVRCCDSLGFVSTVHSNPGCFSFRYRTAMNISE